MTDHEIEELLDSEFVPSRDLEVVREQPPAFAIGAIIGPPAALVKTCDTTHCDAVPTR